MSSMVRAVTEITPTFILIEDVHWGDPSTLELIEKFILDFQESRMMILLTSRNEDLLDENPNIPIRKLELRGLKNKDVNKIIDHLCEERALPDFVIDDIAQNASGNPFYIEELCKSILANLSKLSDTQRTTSNNRDEHVDIPDILRQTLQSKLEGVSSDSKLIDKASVLGIGFSFEIMKAISDQNDESLMSELSTLVHSDVLHQKGTEIKYATFSFKHSLLQKVCYESLSKKNRANYHFRVAETYEKLSDRSIEQYSEIIAHHFEGAKKFARATKYYRIAGRTAIHKFALRESISHYFSGLKLVKNIEDERERIQHQFFFQTGLGDSYRILEGWSSSNAG